MPERRFPPPWFVEQQDACFVVRDHNGQALSYVYYESEPGRRSAAKLLSQDEASGYWVVVRRVECDEARSPPLAGLTRKHIGHVRPSVASQPKALPVLT